MVPTVYFSCSICRFELKYRYQNLILCRPLVHLEVFLFLLTCFYETEILVNNCRKSEGSN
jgi:hypothetical protein